MLEDGDVGTAKELKKLNMFGSEVRWWPARTKERNCFMEAFDPKTLKVMGVRVHCRVCIAGESEVGTFV